MLPEASRLNRTAPAAVGKLMSPMSIS